MITVADTGFVVAVLNRSDNYHRKVTAVYQRAQTIYLPQTTLTEVAYLLAHRGSADAVAEFLEKLPASKLLVTPVTAQDLERTAAILR